MNKGEMNKGSGQIHPTGWGIKCITGGASPGAVIGASACAASAGSTTKVKKRLLHLAKNTSRGASRSPNAREA